MTSKKSYETTKEKPHRGKLRYLERLVEERDAEQQIKNYNKEEQDEDAIQDEIWREHIQE